MANLEAVVKADALAMARDAQGFFEDVAFWPLGVSANARTIRACVDRRDVQQLSESPNHNAKVVRLRIPRDATYGVTSWVLGKDKCVIAPRIGGSTATVVIRRIVAQDFAFWFVEGDG